MVVRPVPTMATVAFERDGVRHDEQIRGGGDRLRRVATGRRPEMNDNPGTEASVVNTWPELAKS
jgi:hypothetical protein